MDAGRYSSYTQKETFCADVEKTAARFAQISDPSLGTSPGGVGHGPKGIMGKKSKPAHLHLTFALFTSLVTP